MTSQAKFKIILGVLVAVLVLGGGGLVAVYVWLPAQDSTVNVNVSNQVVVNSQDNTNTAGLTNTTLNTNLVEVNTNTPTGAALPDANRILALGRSFTERYGSFSNQNEFENLNRLLTYMTPRLQQSTQEFMASQALKQSSKDPYYGVTTDVVTITIQSQEDKRAVVLVDTRRRESREGQNTTVYSQSAKMVLVKQQGEWLVDKFEWQ